MLEGTCHCGGSGWAFDGDPATAKACNCTLCRRYGVLWAYDFEGERIRLNGPHSRYVRADEADPSLEILFCPACACVLGWRGLHLRPDGRRRIAVNLRLARPEAIGHVPVEKFDGLSTFANLPRDGRCVRDLWF